MQLSLSKLFCYDIVVRLSAQRKLNSLPKSTDIRAAFGEGFENSFCSDLFVAGYSYKQLDFFSDIELDYDDYKLLKLFKKAVYISDRAKELLKENDIISLVKQGLIFVDEGYIHCLDEAATTFLTETILPDSDNPFGIKMRQNSRFRFFIKTEKSTFPEELNICGCPFCVETVKKIDESLPQKYVLQCDLDISSDVKIANDSQSRYKIAYNSVSQSKMILAGSVISREDFFGETLDFISAI